MSTDYDKIVGYSPLDDVDEEKMLQVIKVNRKIIEKFYSPHKNDSILVAGAGNGLEALLLGKGYGLRTFGVDLNIEPVERHQNIYFLRQDISTLAFLPNSFSLIYCYHVLEHVNDHIEVLREFERVLKPQGVLFIGFPNKNRIASYIGTSQKVSIRDRIKWNIHDYVYRVKGKFENKFGAHAGFSEREFLSDTSSIFRDIYPVRRDYMLIKYSRYQYLINISNKLGLGEIIFPSNYYICIK